jgi:hypothetical protein
MKYLLKTIKTLSFLTILLFSISCAARKELAYLQQKNQAQDEKIDTQLGQNISLSDEKKTLLDSITYLTDEIFLLQTKLYAARISLNEIATQQPECPEAMKKGIVFKVQIGAYEERSIPENLITTVVLDTETKGDMQQTVIGQFRNYENADRLQKQLRAMGVEEAWIVPYRNGVRVPLKSVISEIDFQN